MLIPNNNGDSYIAKAKGVLYIFSNGGKGIYRNAFLLLKQFQKRLFVIKATVYGIAMRLDNHHRHTHSLLIFRFFSFLSYSTQSKQQLLAISH
jgi:hypothetical protein